MTSSFNIMQVSRQASILMAILMWWWEMRGNFNMKLIRLINVYYFQNIIFISTLDNCILIRWRIDQTINSIEGFNYFNKIYLKLFDFFIVKHGVSKKINWTKWPLFLTKFTKNVRAIFLIFFKKIIIF